MKETGPCRGCGLCSTYLAQATAMVDMEGIRPRGLVCAVRIFPRPIYSTAMVDDTQRMDTRER